MPHGKPLTRYKVIGIMPDGSRKMVTVAAPNANAAKAAAKKHLGAKRTGTALKDE